MDKKDYLAWASRLVELTESQRDDLRRRANQLKANKAERSSAQDDWLLAGMVGRMLALGVLSRATLPSALRGESYKVYSGFASVLREELDALVGPAERGLGRAVMARLATDAVAEWLDRNRLERTPGMFLRNACRAVEGLSRQFPGYMEAGMFHVVLTREFEK